MQTGYSRSSSGNLHNRRAAKQNVATSITLRTISTAGGPCCMEHVVVHSAKIVCVELTDVHGRSVVTLEKDSGQESFTIGDVARTDVMFNVAYVMNDAGKTVGLFSVVATCRAASLAVCETEVNYDDASFSRRSERFDSIGWLDQSWLCQEPGGYRTYGGGLAFGRHCSGAVPGRRDHYIG